MYIKIQGYNILNIMNFSLHEHVYLSSFGYNSNYNSITIQNNDKIMKLCCLSFY